MKQTVDQTYICLEVNELSGNLSLTEYVMDISAKLGSVRLTDYFFQGKFHVVCLKSYKKQLMPHFDDFCARYFALFCGAT